jgi:hypothetical protein
LVPQLPLLSCFYQLQQSWRTLFFYLWAFACISLVLCGLICTQY